MLLLCCDFNPICSKKNSFSSRAFILSMVVFFLFWEVKGNTCGREITAFEAPGSTEWFSTMPEIIAIQRSSHASEERGPRPHELRFHLRSPLLGIVPTLIIAEKIEYRRKRVLHTIMFYRFSLFLSIFLFPLLYSAYHFSKRSLHDSLNHFPMGEA